MVSIDDLSQGDMRGRLIDREHMKGFVFAGNAVFTLRSIQSGVRFTYRVKRKDDVWFVMLRSGPNHETYLGMIKGGEFMTTRSSKVSILSPSWRAFDWFLRGLLRGGALRGVEFWHEGKCGKCGRPLTVPESIAVGLGPQCRSTLAFDPCQMDEGRAR